MKSPREPDLELRGKLIRSLGALREMLPGSFVERTRACGQPNCHCADGKRLHSQYQISVLIDGKPKALNILRNWLRWCAKRSRCADALMLPPLPSARST